MQKILTALSASVALVAAVSVSQACDFHNMSTTAGALQPEAVVAMSTAQPPTIAENATPKRRPPNALPAPRTARQPTSSFSLP